MLSLLYCTAYVTVTETLYADFYTDNQVEITSCSVTHNVECDCKKGFYYRGSGLSKYCTKCPGELKERNIETL